MPETRLLQEIRGFAGLNVQSPNNLIASNELQECTNYLVGLEGELLKRPGLEALNTATAAGEIALVGVYPEVQAAGIRIFITNPGSSSTIWYSTNHGATWVAVGTTKPNVDWSANLGGRIFFGNDSTGVHEYSQSTNLLTALTSSPSGFDGIVFKQRLFVIPYVTGREPGRIQFSEPYGAAVGGLFTGAAAWPATNTIDIEGASDGDFIVTMVPINDVLYVFKRYSIWAVYVQGDSPANWVVRKIHNTLGCVGKRGVLQVDNLFYFRSQEGMFATDGVSFTELSRPIRDAVKIPGSYFPSLQANMGFQAPVKYKHWILFPTFDAVTNVRTIWAFNYKTRAWSKLTPSRPSLYFSSSLSLGMDSTVSSLGFVLAGVNTSSPINVLYGVREGAEVLLDHASNFTAYLRTKDFDFGSMGHFKIVDWIGADVFSKNVLLEYTADEIVSAGSVSVEPTVPRRFVKAPGPSSCRRISVALNDAGASHASFVYGLSMYGSMGAPVSGVSTK